MRGVFFDQRVATVARSPYRADVALFVGFVDRRRMKHAGGKSDDERVVQPIAPDEAGKAGHPLHRWLEVEGWIRGRSAPIDELLNVPVPIDSFSTFDRLFAWDWRPWQGGYCDTYLGTAVRSFFMQGGRLCYVVRVDAPWRVAVTPADSTADIAQRAARVERLIPSVGGSPGDARTAWNGVWLIHGLPEISFLAMPDLPELARGPITDAKPPVVAIPVTAPFVECAVDATKVTPDEQIRSLQAPTADDAGFTAWQKIVSRLVDRLRDPSPGSTLREVQLVATLPQPEDARVGAEMVRRLTADHGLDLPPEAGGLSTSFLQLAYPWLGTAESRRAPGGLEPPDGALCGVLAANALERGTYRSAGGRKLVDVVEARPVLPARDASDPSDLTTLAGRVSLLGRVPGGFELLSDVTTSKDPTFRLAHANRLMASLVRALRVIGEGMAFSPSNESTWSELRMRTTDVLRQFWRAGALRGAKEGDAFQVRCDRSTMSQSDLDNGRVIVEVIVDLTVSIQRINVTVTRNGGSVTMENAA